MFIFVCVCEDRLCVVAYTHVMLSAIILVLISVVDVFLYDSELVKIVCVFVFILMCW